MLIAVFAYAILIFRIKANSMINFDTNVALVVNTSLTFRTSVQDGCGLFFCYSGNLKLNFSLLIDNNFYFYYLMLFTRYVHLFEVIWCILVWNGSFVEFSQSVYDTYCGRGQI